MIFLYAIDMDKIACLEPFLPLYDHFEIRRFWGLKCKLDLTLRLRFSKVCSKGAHNFLGTRKELRRIWQEDKDIDKQPKRPSEVGKKSRIY